MDLEVVSSYEDHFVIKLLRAVGGCLGIERRRRTCKPAISFGELERSNEPENSEWGNPVGVISHYARAEYIGSVQARPAEVTHLSRQRKRNL